MAMINCGGVNAALEYAISIDGELAIASYIDRSQQVVRGIGAGLNYGAAYIDGRRAFYGAKNDTYYTAMQNGKEKFHHAMTVNSGIGKKMVLYTVQTKEEAFYSALMENYDLPLIREWTGEIFKELLAKGRVTQEARLFGNPDAEVMLGDARVRAGDICGCRINVTEHMLEETVSSLIKGGRIKVARSSQNKLRLSGMDEYFSQFSTSLVENLKSQLKPVSEHTQEMPYMALNNMRLYPQQITQDVGCIRQFLAGHSRYVILNMGMGTGKTIQTASICEGFANAKAMRKTGRCMEQLYRDGDVSYRNIIMCPSHLVQKWVSEIKREIPGAKAEAVTDFDQLLKIRAKGAMRTAKEFYVISKDFAKLSYMSRPCVSKIGKRKPRMLQCGKCKTYKPSTQRPGDNVCRECGEKYALSDIGYGEVTGVLCPECGEVLIEDGKYVDGSPKALSFEDFTAQNRANSNCPLCGASLWAPCVSNLDCGGEFAHWSERSNPWKRVTHYANKAHKSKKTVWLHRAHVQEYLDDIGEEALAEKDEVRGTRKYAPAQFVKKYLKGYFDIAVFDEMHLYKGGATAQGNAMHALIKASRYQIGLTGTIAGGYANHLFYTLFRLDPRRMKSRGFEFGMEMPFCEQYGTVEREFEYNETTEGDYNQSSRGKQLHSPKVKPGISPKIFTDFLLDRAVFLDLSDMSKYLPKLKEQVITVPLEDEVRKSYSHVVGILKEKSRQKGNFGLLGKMLQFSLSYSDKPYGIQAICSPYDGSVVAVPDSHEQYKEELLNKEKKLVELVGSELSEGRGCMIFAEYTASPETCVSYRLKKILMDNLGLAEKEVVVLESSSPSAIEREGWIHAMAKKGARVFITNPKCVETGLDLCFYHEGRKYNYPTLIFYQMGYSLFTIWQASKRAYRLNQTEECRNYYLASQGTIQPAVIQLIAEKQVATAAIQGHFSSEGLAAMAQGVDARLKLIQSIASNDTQSENALQEMFDVLAKDTSQEIDSSYRPMRTIRELLGIEDVDMADAGDESPDLMGVFDMLLANELFLGAVIEAKESGAEEATEKFSARKTAAKKTDRSKKLNVFSMFDML